MSIALGFGGPAGQRHRLRQVLVEAGSVMLGIISGSADITTATPSSGFAISKASRIPSVASTCVDKAGPPPETK